MERIIAYLKKEQKITSICEKLDLKEYEVLGLIEQLKLSGKNIDMFYENGELKVRMNDKKIIKSHNEYELYDGRLKTLRFMLMGDTHLCSNYEDLCALNIVYDEAVKRNIKKVFHCGDISDGFYKNRPEHIYSLKAHGADEQAEYIIDNYPKRNGVETLFITGNHDDTHIKNGGANIGKQIEREREDMTYLGQNFCKVVINNMVMHLQHPGGGSSYARSYKLQKHIDAMRGGTKPHILAQGHFHKAFYMFYRNIHAFSVPALQQPSDFTIKNALGNDMGAWFIEAKVDKQGNIITIKPELLPIYETQSKARVLKK